jgi:hypothetical protein
MLNTKSSLQIQINRAVISKWANHERVVASWHFPICGESGSIAKDTGHIGYLRCR